MQHSYITTANGTELTMGSGRHPNARLHFNLVNHTASGAQVWECREIQGTHLALRLTFTSRFTDLSVHASGRTMGALLFSEMVHQEKVSRWEANIAAHGWHSTRAVQPLAAMA